MFCLVDAIERSCIHQNQHSDITGVMPGKRIKIRTIDDIVIDMCVSTIAGAEATVIFFHGNSGTIGQRRNIIERMNSLGYNVVCFDYRGYGESTGEPTERGIMFDCKAVMSYVLADTNLSETKIVLYGQSLGCAVAIRCARMYEISVHKVILENPFRSVVAMIDNIFIWFFAYFILMSSWNNEYHIRKIQVPVLFLVSGSDNIVPPSHGEHLYKICPSPDRLIYRLNADHFNAVTLADYWKYFHNFIKN